jgi:hypothetical protein
MHPGRHAAGIPRRSGKLLLGRALRLVELEEIGGVLPSFRLLQDSAYARLLVFPVADASKTGFQISSLAGFFQPAHASGCAKNHSKIDLSFL